MILLKNTDRKITNIIHISDLHVRLNSRHDEYRSVFKELYNKLDIISKNTQCLLVIAGDVFHSKNNLEPESIDLCSNFLKSCSDILPTILIAGNHDALLSNRNRLDSLSPIVNTLNHTNLYYLKKTEVYRYENILFNNFSIFDSVDKYIKYEDIPECYRNETDYHIALFHGPVNNAITDIGYVVSNRTIENNLFDGHHIAMLGDIHKHQCLQDYNEDDQKPVIVYPSSILQNHHGEDIRGHGFVLWDLKSKQFKHYELPNEYGYFTIEINKGKLVTDITNIPKKARIRTKCFETIPSQVKDILSEVKKKCEIVESTFIRIDVPTTDITLNSGQIFDIHNILDVDYQNKLIQENLLSKNISDELIKKVKEINKETNLLISKDKFPKNVRWKPKTFEFSNMFNYGEDNFIDFTKLKGTVGLFAKNGEGKTNTMEALSFCIFDKFSKGFKALHVLNHQKMNFRCKFNFEVNGTDYFIERIGTSDKKGNVKVDVKFWKIVNNDIIELNGEARRSTNDIIRDYVGTYEDFMLTTLSVQNNKMGSFIDLGQTERKDLLCQFMGLTVFDQLYTISNNKFKETNTLLQNFGKDQLNEDLKDESESIEQYNKKIELYNFQIKQWDIEKEDYNNKILDLSKNITSGITTNINILVLEKEKIAQQLFIDGLSLDIQNKNKQIHEIDAKILQISSSLKQCGNVDERYDQYKEHKRKESEKSKEIEKLKSSISSKIDKLKKLEEHKYDPNCDFCINNVFVRDAIKTKEELVNDKNIADIIVKEYNSIKIKIESYGDIESEVKLCKKYNQEKMDLEKEKSSTINLILKIENNLVLLKNQMDDIIEKMESFYKNKDVIENNSKLLKEIDNIRINVKRIESEYKLTNNNIFMLSGEKGKSELKYNTTLEQLSKIKELESSYDAYKLYTEIISRDGIPYEIIVKTIPQIEKDVNNVLHQIVDFTVSLNTDGKNIMTYIVYDDKKWPLEMASGMEKFISGLALRTALINISNLPKSTFSIFDEGWGTLDQDHLSQVKSMLDYLKCNFDFIWVISHIDFIKDITDISLEIKKENGFSQIRYV